MPPIKLIIDTDPGIDDAMAILAAFNSPEEVEVLALTTVYGNVPTPLATRNALHLAERAGRADVPVYEGAHRSLTGVAKAHLADFVHGADGFGGVPTPPPARSAAPGAAAAAIAAAAAAHPGEVVVLALASLTNLALALGLDPELPKKLKRVVVLGGAYFVPGNVNPAAEANVFGDPEAASTVFRSGADVWALGLDVTHRCVLPGAALAGLAGRGAHGTFLSEISAFYLAYHRRAYGMEAVFVHDAAALAAVVAPQLFDWTRGRVLVVEEGPARGRTVMDNLKRTWMGTNAWQGLPDAQVALGVRDDALVEWVLERMGRGASADAGAA